MNKDKLEKVLWKPGICSSEELNEGYNFLKELNVSNQLFVSAFGSEPVGWTIQSILDGLEYYKESKK